MDFFSQAISHIINIPEKDQETWEVLMETYWYIGAYQIQEPEEVFFNKICIVNLLTFFNNKKYNLKNRHGNHRGIFNTAPSVWRSPIFQVCEPHVRGWPECSRTKHVSIHPTPEIEKASKVRVKVSALSQKWEMALNG